MAIDDIMRKLTEAARNRANELDLPELYYPLEDSAKILDIGRTKLYRYINDEEFQIEPITFENDRRQYLLSDDIRRLYAFLHSPYVKRNGRKVRPPLRAQTLPQVSALPTAPFPAVPAALRPTNLVPTNGRH